MKKAWWIAVLPGIAFVFLAMLLVALFLLKILWAWTIPDLFPGAVDQGLIAREISWLSAFKVAIFISVLAGIAGGRKSKNS